MCLKCGQKILCRGGCVMLGDFRDHQGRSRAKPLEGCRHCTVILIGGVLYSNLSFLAGGMASGATVTYTLSAASATSAWTWNTAQVLASQMGQKNR